MATTSDFWGMLAGLAGGVRTLQRWQAELGAGFPVVKGCLKRTGRVVRHVKCDACGCNHRVVPNPDVEGYMAVCDCTGHCEGIVLTARAALGWSLDTKRLLEMAVKRLPVQTSVRAVGDHGLWELGKAWMKSGQAKTLLACLTPDRQHLEAGLADLFSAGTADVLLLVPFERWCGSDYGRRIESVGGEICPLGGFLSVADGRLVRGPIVGQWLAEGPGEGTERARKSTRGMHDEGASYRVRMPEGEFTMPKRAGEQYVFWFVRNAGKDIGALDLVTQVRGMGSRAVAGEWIDDEEDGKPVDGVDVNGQTTREVLEDLRAELRTIKSERDRAEKDGDLVRVGELDDQVDAIQSRIAKDTNRFGKIRKVADDETKAAGSIVRGLNRCYARARKGGGKEKARRAFVEHFKQCLRLGRRCRYEPPQGTEWEVSPR